MLPLAAVMGCGEPAGVEPPVSPGITRNREGPPDREISSRMIFSAAAFTVRLSIFFPMAATSMRTMAPSSVHAPEPSNCEAEAWPARSSAAQTAWRRDSAVTSPELILPVGSLAATGAMASDPSVSASAEPTAWTATLSVGNGAGATAARELADLSGAADAWWDRDSNEAAGADGAVCFAGEPQLELTEPKGEACGVWAGAGNAAAGRTGTDGARWPGAAEAVRATLPWATLLSSSSSGNRRCAWMSLSNASSRWKRCSWR